MARRVAAYLRSLDLKPGSHIGLVSKNCREWIIADLAIMMAGHVSVPFFATLTGNQIAEVLKLGDVDLLIAGKIEVWEDMGKGVPADMPMIHFPHYEGNSDIMRGKAWRDILAEFEPIKDSPLPDPEGLWTIIFTSGTTGTPKGVMLTNKALIELMDKLQRRQPLLQLPAPQPRRRTRRDRNDVPHPRRPDLLHRKHLSLRRQPARRAPNLLLRRTPHLDETAPWRPLQNAR